MVFTDFKIINVPQTNGNVLLYTTTSLCMIWFVPRGSNMETDSPCGIYIQNFYSDTDGQIVDPFIFYSHDSLPSTNSGGSGSHSHQVTSVGFNGTISSSMGTYLNIPMIVPAGKAIRSFVGDSSDRLGGKLYVLELPNDSI